MNETELLRKVSIQIYKKDNYRGSGALIETNGKFYVITATHVISDSESEPLDLNDFFGKSEEYEQIRFGSLIGEFEQKIHAEEYGTFLTSGKSDKLERNIPYYPLIQAFDEILQHIFSMSSHVRL